MKAVEIGLKGCYIIESNIFEDKRGHFFEAFHQSKFEEIIGQSIKFVQDNQSKSGYGVLRGLHFQKGEYSQAKLVRVLSGEILDVAVDLRKNSPTFGQYESVILSGENKRQLFIPRGFGHGFVVLSDTAELLYKCDNFYNKNSEAGIIYNDRTLNIDWKIQQSQLIISSKDLLLPVFENVEPYYN